jgi:L,D-peptidoglycan transpeptidase YkuD (ErfK/YbiS/YcfS/YnhG family)
MISNVEDVSLMKKVKSGYPLWAMVMCLITICGCMFFWHGTVADASVATQYATVEKTGSTIWTDAQKATKSGTTDNALHATYPVTESVSVDGAKLYQLAGLGYVASDALKITDQAQGAATTVNQYVTITSKNYTVWGNFTWKTRHYTRNYYHHTYLAKYAYHHSNGLTYYSLYDAKGKWFGYLNQTSTKTGNGAQGAAIASSQYVTIAKSTYTVWGNFGWRKSRHASKNWLNKTFLAKITYFHSNGATYYSLYDGKGKWFGYLNATAVQNASGAQGVATGFHKYVRITSKTATVWGSFKWQGKYFAKNWYNHVFEARYAYHHINGSTYYSLYLDGWWFGYLNAGCVKTASKPAATALSYAARSKTAKKTNQIIATVANKSNARVYLFEQSGGVWVQVLSVAGRVGYNGVGTAHEGSGRTPRGSYPLTLAFGIGANPGAKLSYRRITNKSYYISNPKDKQYNTWQERSKSSKLDEHMADYPTQYKYGLVIGYNHGVGGGSAFFVHCNGKGSTAGCVSVPTSTMLTLIRRIHKGAQIINVTGNAQLRSY